jgi:hypothetical protein
MKPHDGQNTRHEPSEKQAGNAGLGQKTIDNHDYAGRDQDADRATGGHCPGSQPVVVVVAAHLRQGDLRHCGRRGEAGPADRGKSTATANRGEGQSAASVAEPGIARAIQRFAEFGFPGQVTHQDEHWDDRQIICHRGVVSGLAQ